MINYWFFCLLRTLENLISFLLPPSIPLFLLFKMGGLGGGEVNPNRSTAILAKLPLESKVRPASYVRYVISLMFWVGIAVQFPLGIFAITGMGLIRAKTL